MPPTRGISCLSMVLNGIRSGGTAEIRDSHKDTVKGGQSQKESIIGGIIILLTPAPLTDPFQA